MNLGFVLQPYPNHGKHSIVALSLRPKLLKEIIILNDYLLNSTPFICIIIQTL